MGRPIPQHRGLHRRCRIVHSSPRHEECLQHVEPVAQHELVLLESRVEMDLAYGRRDSAGVAAWAWAGSLIALVLRDRGERQQIRK